MKSKKDRSEDEHSTADRILEEMTYQTDILGRMLAEMERASCQLEQVVFNNPILNTSAG